jgi:hypothetical protein
MQIRQLAADLGIQVGEADLQAVETALQEYLLAVDALGPAESAAAPSPRKDLDGWLAPDVTRPETSGTGQTSALRTMMDEAAE